MTQSLFFSPQVTSFPAQGTWAGEGRNVCGRREQQGVEGRGVLGLITCLGLKGKFTLFFAMCFIDRLSTGPRGCPHRHWCETGSLGGWKAAAKQNIADSSGSGSILKWQLGPILEKLLGTDSSLLCGWDIMAGTAAIIQRAPVLYSSSAVGLFSGWLCIRYPLFQEPNAFYCQGEASLSYLMRSLSPRSCTAQSTSPCTSEGVWQIRGFLTLASWTDDAECPLVSPCPGKNQWHHFRWLHQSRLGLVPWSLTQVLIWDRAMALIIPRDQPVLMLPGVFEGWGQGCTGWKLFLWTLLPFAPWLIFGSGWQMGTVITCKSPSAVHRAELVPRSSPAPAALKNQTVDGRE